MHRDVNAFRERFQRWKAGEQVYDRGRVIHASFGLDDEEPTDAIQRRQTPLEYQRATWRTNAQKDQERLAQALAANYAEVGPAQHVPQHLQEYYRKKDETAKWVAQKKALEQATDEIMAAFVDPRYVVGGSVAGAAISGAWRAAKAAVTGSKLYRSYKISKAINKAVKQGAYVQPSEAVFPGQVGWAPKTRVSGYHASNEENLQPDFWFNGWAQQRGAPRGFYIAGGDAPEGGFLSKRPYVHSVETEFEKPMVQVGDIPTQPGVKNTTRNSIEQQARSMGADGIIYQDIKDNQLAHQHIAKTLHPDVKVNVQQKAIGPTEYDVAEEVGSFGGNVVKQNKVRGRGVRQNTNGTINVEPEPVVKYNNQTALPPKVGADALVDSKGNVNMHHLANLIKQFYKKYPNAGDFREIKNSGLGGETNLWEHIRDVVRSAQAAPVPKGSTRQEFIQAALLHDIGKTLDRSYSGHPEASLKILDEMGIEVSPKVRRAIQVHMRGSNPYWNETQHGSLGEGTPLTRALHFVDVVRSKNPMTNAKGGAFYEYRNLLYPTEEQYKIAQQYGWDTDYQLKNIINPILNTYGYKEIELGLSAQEARRQLIQRIQQHRRFVRGVHGLGDASDPGNRQNLQRAIDQFVRREGRKPTTEELYLQASEYYKKYNTAANGGNARGANSYMHKMELPWDHYMSLYTSNSSETPLSFMRTSTNPRALQVLEMPVQDNPEWSLAELWGYNDYPLTYSWRNENTLTARDFNSEWRNRILPYVLDNGTKGNPINLDTQQNEWDFLNRNRPKFQAQAAEEYKKIAHTFKDVMPSDIEPSDFMEGYFKNFAISPSGQPMYLLDKPVFESRHFRPVFNQYSVPFPPLGSGMPTASSAPVKPQVQGFYFPKGGGYNTFSFGRSPEKLNETIQFINKTLRRYGIDTEISPYMYTRLSDKTTVLKYPRALEDLYLKVLAASYNDGPIPPHIKLRRSTFGSREPLPPSKQYRHLTAKQIQAHNNANKPKYVNGIDVNQPYFGPDGEAIAANTKYVPSTKSLMQKYIREYFKAIRQAKSKDAFVRRAVASYKNSNRKEQWVSARTSELLDAALKQYRLNRFSIPDDYQHSFPFPLWSRDGYKVFVTQHGEGPGFTHPEHYVFVGKREAKTGLKVNTKYNFKDSGRRYNRGMDRIGDIYPGLTRNGR